MFVEDDNISSNPQITNFCFCEVQEPEGDFSNAEIINTIISQINNPDPNQPVEINTFFDNFITTYYLLKSEIKSRKNLDSLAELEVYSSTFGRSLLYKHTDQLLSSSSINQGIELLKSLEGITFIDHWVDHFYSKYNLDQKFNSNWNITSNAGRNISFKDLLAENRGRLLYVDLWASWCPPSIEEMHSLEKLIADYQHKPFTIVNISVDNETEKWGWADNKYLQFNKRNSYLLDSTGLPTITKTFSLKKYPRYLLFDQNGNLIHANAPKPGSKEIRKLIENSFANNIEYY